ncbi:protein CHLORORESPIRATORY REDUCTION 6, chloroplastic-like isoform X2 [Silene latifolia]|uniref:protein CHLORORESPIRATORY REDUCTION 6, chloroplastic-like isoform X2 n=1 Tax=Silene latifolia TaxID=37657 RepID=UPI003D77FF2B
MAGEIKCITPLIHPSYRKPIPPISIGWSNPNLQIVTNIETRPQRQRLVPTSVSFNPQGSYDFSLLDDDNFDDQAEPKAFLERTIGFTINYTRDDPYDNRELSEFPDVRLWFVRLDATYPWLPVLLDWRAGELARYAAMLVPHQMSMRMGVVFNPEALELFIMNKVFIVYSWLLQHGVPQPKARSKTSDMARMLGFGIGDDLFNLIDNQPVRTH